MVLIIAEAGVNHNGSLDLAKDLVDAAVYSGADIVKFQTFKAENLVTVNAKKAISQIQNTSTDESQLNILKNLELSFDQQIILKKYCDKKNIEFLSTGFDIDSLMFLKSLNLKRYKIPSGEITNLPYLRLIGSFKKPIILSTGMSNIYEIKEALKQINYGGTEIAQITVLHCTTEYPAPLNDINLRAMETIKKKFNVSIGYSDHTSGIEISLAAAALGAKVIEKHLTLDKNLEGPDHKASLEPDQFLKMCNGIRKIEIALGSQKKEIKHSEIKNALVARKSLFAKKNIRKNELFTEENICAKRPGNGISPMRWEEIIGTKSKRDFNIDDMIEI